MAAKRTNRPFALAANASAETARAHCTQFSAARRYSPDRPLVWAKTGEIQTDPSLRLASTVETRTNQPVARAAIADAAFFRNCSKFRAAMQPASWERPFKATISVDFKPSFRCGAFQQS